MLLNKWTLPTIGILLLLMISCSGDDLRNSDSEEGEAIQMHFNLQPVEMEAIASATTKAISSRDEALSVAMGLSGTTSTRSSTGIDESAINEVCILQFDGTVSTSTLVAKEYYSSPNTTNLETTLIESSSDQTVYVVANVGDITGNYTIGTTTIADFQTSTLSFATEASVTSGTDLPMIGTYTGATMPGLYAVSLTRMVAKLGFTCNVSLTNTSDAFTLTSVRLYSVTNVAQMNTPTGTYPANSSTDASKYINYTAESYTAGSTLTWYIPENLRGTVSTITTEQDKNKTNAPDYSTYIELEGIYTPNGETAEYVTYRIYPGANMTTSFDISRNTYYSISMTIKGMNEVDSRVLLPENMSTNNAGTQVTANCYIANDGNQNYKFKATVMGNGATTAAATSGTQTAAAITPTTLSPTTAFVVWETGSKGDVIEDGSVKLVSGYVRFKTADNSSNGNAVIAVTDGTNILWSWHIWKTTYAPDTNYETYITYASRSFKMMKYNLGATETSNWSSTAANAGDLGLLYQWGRKDPFLGASGWNSSSFISATYTSNYDRTNVLNTAATASGYSGADATIRYAIKNPTHFIYRNSTATDTYDWLNVATRSEQRDNLWGNPNTSTTVPNSATGSKSIYDPCPPGWRTPPQDSFTRFITTTSRSTSTVSEFNVSSSTFDNGWNFYYTATGSGATSYYPALGYQFWSSGTMMNAGTVGGYWSSSSYASDNISGGYIGFHTGLVGAIIGNYRATGFSVRCAQE